MGKLTNLNPPVPIADADIPATIARDAETAAAVAAHVGASDPHSQYLTQPEGDGRYRQSAVALTDADIPATMARDSEVTAAISAHAGASDPHPVYTTQTEVAASISTHEAKINTAHIFYSYGDIGTAQPNTGAVNFLAAGATAAERSQNGAFIAFHRPGISANYFGLSLYNDLRFGGWSNAGSAWRVWHENYGVPVWQAPSDPRLKKGIRPIESALYFILKAKPISFEYKPSLIGKWSASDYDRKKIHYGFNAEEFPITDLVSEKDNGYLGLDYLEIVPFLVRAIQELAEELEKLKAK